MKGMRHTYVWFLLLLTVIYLSPCEIAGQRVKFNRGKVKGSSYYSEIPYELVKGKIIIPVRIEGKQYRFLLDTGAPNLISYHLKEQLTVKELSSIRINDSNDNRKYLDVVKGPLLELGGVEFKDTPTVVTDQHSNQIFDCFGLDGIIGSNMLRNSLLQIRSKDSLIIITDDPDKLSLDANYIRLSKSSNQSSPYIRIQMFGSEKVSDAVLFDTGMQGFFDLSYEDYQSTKTYELYSDIVSAEGHKGIGLFGPSKKSKFIRASVNKMELAGVSFMNVPTISTTSDHSRIGSELCEYGTVTVDYKNERFYFDPDEPSVDLYESQWGFSPSIEDGKVVVGVIWDKDLEQKMTVGDSIVSINQVQFEALDVCYFMTKELPFDGVEELQLTLKNEEGEIVQLELTKK